MIIIRKGKFKDLSEIKYIREYLILFFLVFYLLNFIGQ